MLSDGCWLLKKKLRSAGEKAMMRWRVASWTKQGRDMRDNDWQEAEAAREKIW
jgi:hypothetical protein